jgi:ribosome-binding protein aMBF1 (putative translation factor)
MDHDACGRSRGRAGTVLSEKDTENTSASHTDCGRTEDRLLREEKEMSDLQKYIKDRKSRDPEFAKDFDSGYEQFKIGVMLKQARLDAGITQEELAARLNTKKTAISRIENHAEDIKLSTLEKFVRAVGKRLTLQIA